MPARALRAAEAGPAEEAEIEASDLLIGLGEVAVTVAGFSGIVAVLGVRSLEQLSPVAKARLANLLVTALAAAFFSFLPPILDLFGAGPIATWSVSGLALSVFAVGFAVARGIGMRRLGLGAPQGPRVWVAWIFLATLGLVVAAQLANLAGLLGVPSAAPYAAGVLALLVLSGIQFAMLVTVPGGPPAGAGPA